MFRTLALCCSSRIALRSSLPLAPRSSSMSRPRFSVTSSPSSSRIPSPPFHASRHLSLHHPPHRTPAILRHRHLPNRRHQHLPPHRHALLPHHRHQHLPEPRHLDFIFQHPCNTTCNTLDFYSNTLATQPATRFSSPREVQTSTPKQQKIIRPCLYIQRPPLFLTPTPNFFFCRFTPTSRKRPVHRTSRR